MTIGFNNSFPWWVLVVVAVVAATFTIVVYRKHDLSSPWNSVLPSLRILTICLLVLMLKQPRLVKVEESIDRGRVAILIDNSGSMSIHDDYSPAKQVELASKLGLLNATVRNAGFNSEADNLESINSYLRRINRRLYSLSQAIQRKNKLEAEAQSDEIIRFYTKISQILNDMPGRLGQSLESYSYLKDLKPQQDIDVPGTRVKGLTFKLWKDIPGNELKDLTSAESFQREPQLTRLVPNFNGVQNSGSNLGVVLHGYIHPPVSGNYVFHISSDDQGALFISSDRSIESKQRICWTRNWTPFQAYNVYPEQVSKPILLEAHKVYYIEAQMKEQFGNDYLTIAWTRPDGQFESPIPGDHLTPYGARIDDFIGPDFDRLYPLVLKMTHETNDKYLQLKADFPKALANGNQGNVEKALEAHRLDVLNVVDTVDDLAREMRKLQEASDLRLAMTGNETISHALIRLRKMSRGEFVREILIGDSFGLLDKLEQKADPKLFVLGDEAKVITPTELPVIKSRLRRTNLSGNIRDIFRYFEDQYLAGVVVFTDGNDNTNSDLRELNKMALERDIPLIGISIGSNRPPRDIAIERVVAPESSFKNDQTLVTAIVKRDGYTGKSITITIKSEGLTLVEKTIPPGLESRVSLELPFTETRSGSLEYSVSAQYFDGEEVKTNNQRLFKINILKDPIRVLLIDTFPRWETRFLSMMMQQDPRFEVTSIFSSLDEGNLTALPLDDTLNSHQILILGDVSPQRFTGDQINVIHSFVTKENGSIFFIAGPNFMPEKYMASPLRDLLPLSLGLTDPKTDVKATTDYHLQLTEDNEQDPITRLANTPEISTKLWRGLPSFHWVQEGIAGVRSADTLVETSHAKWPVIIRASNDRGRIVYVGSDEFWKWRDRAKWTYYHRLWGQLLLWAALDTSQASNKYVKLFTARPEVNLGDSMEVTAKILDSEGHPLTNTRATLDVFDLTSGNVVKIVELNYQNGTEGQYTTVIKNLPSGKYRASPHVPNLEGREASAELRFEVREMPGTEFMELGLNRSKIKAFSTHFLEFEDAQKSLDLIPDLQIPRRSYKEWSIWDMYPALIVIGLLLALEWILRKRLQLP